MKKKSRYRKAVSCVLLCIIFAGCANNHGTEGKFSPEDEKAELAEEKIEEEKIGKEKIEKKKIDKEKIGKEKIGKEKIDKEKVEKEDIEKLKMESGGDFIETDTEDSAKGIATEPETVEADWSEYFNGLNGAAVIYDVTDRKYTMYHRDLALTRRSPCSTFKIISSLVALENGILEPEDSTRTWSGELFWNEDWNRDIDFREAFRTSCVWYYRQLIDDIGKDLMQKELEKLQYGNCDISDWEGRLNTNNNNRALTGFWLESSLLISPKEQVEVMERIFGGSLDYSEKTQNELKQVMLVPDQERTDLSIYGKTGMGKADGISVDAWFTGFAESTKGNIYFCVYLGRTDGMDVSSVLAREIAVGIVTDYCDAESYTETRKK